LKFKPIITEYYNVTINDDYNAATKMLSCISGTGISLLAYKSKRTGEKETVFTLFALKTNEMINAVKSNGYKIDGPYTSLFVEGDDIPGSLAGIFKSLAEHNILIEESSGIANINNGYGVILYMKDKDVERAYKALLG
jgi:hypothetical protein